MSSHRPFVRKITYVVAIGVLLIPLYMLSHPAINAAKGMQPSPGGKLSQLRDSYHLSQSRLGQIDPTSVTIKLATLGMRGVAANILWDKANDYKMKQDWVNRSATLNQITKLQPNFVNVWLNQAWDVSYNTSVQIDDYRERYRWVVKGFDFLKEGIQYNERQPRLPWELGWMISQKIGRSDDKKQFRKLFKEDEDFHQSRPVALRDNWLVGKEWFERAVEMVDDLGVPVMGKGPLIYRSNAAMCQMSYADNLETDGTFGEVAKRAWDAAAKDWHRYGNMDIETSFTDPISREPLIIRLNEKENCEETAKKLWTQLDVLQPGLREKLMKQKRDALTDAQREALDTPAEKRSAAQIGPALVAKQLCEVTPDDVAAKITGAKHKGAVQLAHEIVRAELTADHIGSQREIVNFEYWRTCAEVEQGDDLLSARKQLFLGDRAYHENDLVAARGAYDLGLTLWRKVLDKHPMMGEDRAAGYDLMEMIKRYRRILSQMDEPFPEKFLLQDIIDAYEKEQLAPATSAPSDGSPKEGSASSASPVAAGKASE